MELANLTDQELEAQLVAIAAEQERRKADAAIPSGTTLTVYYDGTSWPPRPTARRDITVQWISPLAAPQPPAALNNIDLWWKDLP